MNVFLCATRSIESITAREFLIEKDRLGPDAVQITQPQGRKRKQEYPTICSYNGDYSTTSLVVAVSFDC